MMRRYSGFTLLEILLVLVLVSLASVAVISTLPSSGKDGAKKQAQALFFRLQLLNEEALLSGHDFGLSVDESKASYRLVQLKAGGWQPLAQQGLDAETQLDANLTLSFELGGTVCVQAVHRAALCVPNNYWRLGTWLKLRPKIFAVNLTVHRDANGVS